MQKAKRENRKEKKRKEKVSEQTPAVAFRVSSVGLGAMHCVNHEQLKGCKLIYQIYQRDGKNKTVYEFITFIV